MKFISKKMQKLNNTHKTALAGFAVWLILLALQFTTLYHEEWARLMLALAALVWLPMALPLISTDKIVLEQILRYSLFPAALMLAIALFLPTGMLAALLILPWLVFTILVALRGVYYLHQAGNRNIGSVTITAAHLFIAVGGAWTMADRLGWQPLGFDPAIVLLTGIHFHYAGFIFPLLAGLATLHFPSFYLKIGSWLAILAVPLTAAGITATQLLHQPFLETLAAMTVTLAGWSTAVGYLDFIVKKKVKAQTRICWTILSFALLASMLLAFLYAIRYWMVIEWLTIPSMRALHGSLNAILVSGSGLLGWQLFVKKVELSKKDRNAIILNPL